MEVAKVVTQDRKGWSDSVEKPEVLIIKQQ